MRNSLLILVLAGVLTSALGFTNLGTDFFVCYPANACREPVGFPIPPASDFDGQLILTSTWATTGYVRNSSGTFNVPFTIPPNSVTTVTIDSTHWIRPTETVQTKGLYIHSDNPISAYFLSYRTPGSTNDMALIFPIPSLGTEYITMCWRDNIPAYNALITNRGPSMFAIVAPFDATTVTITTRVPTEGGHAAGVPWTITLNRYETYQVLANSPNGTTLYDLSGSIVTSDKPIGIIAGNQIAQVPNKIPAADYLIEQMPPLTAWGKIFNVFPIQPRNTWAKDVLKIVASVDGTNITIVDASGTTPVTLNRGETWEWHGQPCDEGSYMPFIGYAADCDGKLLDSPTRITADQPILVGQFITGGVLTQGTPNILTGLGDTPLGDPAFMVVPPEEQYSKRYIFMTPSGYTNDFLNVTIVSGYEGTITLDGGPPTYSTAWFNLPGTTLRGARISLAPGAHILEADTTMLIQMYGYDNDWASYAAVAGQNLNPINADYTVVKYCTHTPAMSGTYTTWRIVLVQNGGDPGHGIMFTDTLPTGFTYGSTPATIELFGTATRDSVVNPSFGDSILHWGWFSTSEGDSIVITFTVDIAFGVEGVFDNPICSVDDSGTTTTNAGGLLGPQDDVVVILPAYPIADAGWDLTICLGDTTPIGGSPTATGGTPPYIISWTSIPAGFTSSLANPRVWPMVTTDYIVAVTDSNGLSDADTCRIIVSPPPTAGRLIPDPCGLITSCDYQEIVWWMFDDMLGIIPDSTVVRINGVNYRPGTELSVTTATAGTTLVTFTPAAPGWTHGSVVVSELLQAMNYAFCTTNVPPCSFIVDLEPPIIRDTIPSHGSTLYESSPTIGLLIEDIPAGVDPASFGFITVRVDGAIVSGWTTSWDGSNLRILGLSFVNGDTVQVCLDSLFDAPGYTYCPPNDTSFCWEFYVRLSTPFAEIVEPLDLNFDGVAASACTCQPILIYLHDDIGIDDTTIQLQVDGAVYRISDPWLSYFGDTLRYQPAMPCWSEGTHNFSLLFARNIAGVSLPAPISGSFVIDLSPPYFTNISPLPGTFVGASPTVSLRIRDDGIGLVESELYITIEGIPYALPTAGLTWDGTTFTANLASLGLAFTDGEIIDLCLMGARDDPDYCDPNSADTCWQLIVNLASPTATVILPALGAISACEYQGVCWFVEASNGIDPATAVVDANGSMYDYSTGVLVYSAISPTSGRLCWEPPSPWSPYDTALVCLVELEDSMAHAMLDTVCAQYYIDLVAPRLYGLSPIPGSETSSTSPVVDFCLDDILAGTDGTSVTLTVEGVPYSFGAWTSHDTCLFWDAGAFSLEFSEGDTISLCLHAEDAPDTCAANILDTCWTLIMPPPHVYAHAGVDVSVCPGDSIELGCRPSAYGGVPPYTWQWTQIGSSWTSGDPNPLIYPTATASYVLHVIDDALIPTEDWDTITITVDFVPTGPPIMVSPTAGAMLPPSPTPVSFIWRTPSGTGTFDYDVIIDGAIVAAGIPDTSYSAPFPCGEVHSWGIIARNTCATEYFYCFADTTGDSSFTYLGPDNIYSATAIDSGRVFRTYPCGGPVPSIIRPFDGAFTACNPDSIIIQIDDTSGIVAATIELEVDGVTYTTSHGFLSFYAPNRLVFAPGADFWSDGDVVDVELLHAENSYGVDLATTLSFSFTVDYSAPVFSASYPAVGGYVPGFITSAGFDAVDALSGVDPALTCIVVNGPGYSDTYCFGDPCVTFDAPSGHFEIDLSCAGYDFVRGDTIQFCAISGDSPDYCSPNIDTLCWTIYIIDCDLGVTIDMPDTVICDASAGLSFPINATTTGGTPPYIYLWAPGGGAFIDGHVEDITATPPLGMVTRYIIQVTDSTGCVALDTVFVTVSSFTANAGGDIWVCPDGSGIVGCPPVFYGDPVGAVSTTWRTLGGTVVSTDSSFVFTPTATTTLVLEVVDVAGCISRDTMVVHYDHVGPGPFGWIMPEPDETLAVGNVDICWEMPPGTAPIYFDFFLDSLLTFEGIPDTCVTVGPFPCGQVHSWFVESYNYCFPIDCSGETLWVVDSFDTMGGVFVPGDTFAGGFDPPFWTEPCPTGVPQIIQPFDGAWSACDDQIIQLKIVQPDSGLPLDPTTFELEVEGVAYTVDGAILAWDGDSILSFTPPALWIDDQTVDIRLLRAEDTDGNTVNGLPFEWSFRVDLLAPATALVSPPLVDQTSSPVSFEFTLTDGGSGIDPTTMILIVDGTTYPIGSNPSWTDPTLLFNALGAGLSWSPGDSIIIEVIAGDSPDYCAPNTDTTRFAWFVRDPNPPVPSIVSPNDGDFSACDPESIVIRIDDPNGVNESSIELIVNSVSYTTASPELTWSEPLLVFRPSPMWADGAVVDVRLTHAEDNFGNDITSALTFSFTIDLSPPNANMTLPLPNSMTRDTRQNIDIAIADALSGVDPLAIVLTIDGTNYSHGDFSWTSTSSTDGIVAFMPENHNLTFIAGDTVLVGITVFDSPDRCAANSTQFSWLFVIEPEVGCAVIPNPITPNFDEINDNAVFTYPNMMSEQAEIIVFDSRNIEVWRASVTPAASFGDFGDRIWNGLDSAGKPAPAGLYLYVIMVNDEIVCNGTVVILR